MAEMISDREGDTLRVDALVDTLYLEAIESEGAELKSSALVALDLDGVERLRDICNAMLAANGRTPAESSSS